MSYISEKIKEFFPDLAIMKNSANNSLFAGRNLPSFVKDYIIRRFSNEDGLVDRAKVSDYLENKMPDNIVTIKNRLLAGEQVNVTVRFVIKSDLASGRTTYSIPDAQISSNAYIASTLMEEYKDELVDGERWGNITLNYVEPQGRRSGYIEMVAYKSFDPYKIDYSYFMSARQNFKHLRQRIKVILRVLGRDIHQRVPLLIHLLDKEIPRDGIILCNNVH